MSASPRMRHQVFLRKQKAVVSPLRPMLHHAHFDTKGGYRAFAAIRSNGSNTGLSHSSIVDAEW